MSPTNRFLSQWDLALLDRHQRFYVALASGERQPTTALQAHFVAVAYGHARPATQHEVAFQRFRDGGRDPRCELPGQCVRPAPTAYPTMRAERSVDLADAAQLETLAAEAQSTFQSIRGLYIEGKATARRATADASVWIATALADTQLARSLEHWTSDTFGKLSNVYTQALDGGFVNGLKPGTDYVSPWLHRLFEGHTVGTAWRAARSALPDDSFAEEVVGWLRALGSDFVTIVGLPVTSLTPENYAQLETFVCETFGVSREWLSDVLHMNAVEGLQLAAGCVPIIAALMGWSRRDAETYASLAAKLGVGAVVAANPIMILVALAMLARAYQMAKDSEARGLWRQIVEGGAPTAAALGIASMAGGPPLFGVAAGLIVAKGIQDALKSGQGFERSEWLEEPATRIATVVAKLRSHRGWTPRDRLKES
jgi:hypothetical protein